MKTLLVSLALALPRCPHSPPVADSAGADALRALHGTFVSPAVEEWYGGFGTREFVFADGQWSLIFTHALDPQMTRAPSSSAPAAPIAWGPSPAVDGAFHTVFDEDWKHLTLLTAVPEIVAGMGMADCGLTPNLEADISDTGCAAWRPWPSAARITTSSRSPTRACTSACARPTTTCARPTRCRPRFSRPVVAR
jgi:hypothetical protein